MKNPPLQFVDRLPWNGVEAWLKDMWDMFYSCWFLDVQMIMLCVVMAIVLTVIRMTLNVALFRVRTSINVLVFSVSRLFLEITLSVCVSVYVSVCLSVCLQIICRLDNNAVYKDIFHIKYTFCL